MSTIITLKAQGDVTDNSPKSAKWKKGERYNFKHEVILPSSSDKVFPLLCPVREYEWFNDWKCTMIYSESGVAENNGIFYTTMGFPLFKKQIFYVINYVPNENITFLIFINKIATLKFGATLEQMTNDSCRLTLDYTITGLSGFGNTFLKNKALKELGKNAHNIEVDLIYWLQNNKKRPK